MAENNEELDYSEDEPESSGFFRWLQVVIVMCALGGFFGLAWYAYKSDDTVDEKDVELIKVDKTPAKQPPEESEKQQIPNQDKTVYNLMNSTKAENPPVVERILPSAEDAMQQKNNGTETWTSDKLKNKEQTSAANTAKPQLQVVENAPPVQEKAPPQQASKKAEQFNPARIREQNTAAPQAAAAPSAPVSPKPVAKPEAKSAAESDDDDETATKDEAQKPAAGAALPSNKIRVQLGAYQSNEEAEQEWGKISHRFSSELNGKQHYIMRVEIEGKGTFYRLQAAPFASTREADALCLTLIGAQQGCFLAKGK